MLPNGNSTEKDTSTDEVAMLKEELKSKEEKLDEYEVSYKSPQNSILLFFTIPFKRLSISTLASLHHPTIPPHHLYTEHH